MATNTCNLQFQSTLPRRERRHGYKKFQHAFGFQSTLPRRERLSGNTNAVTKLLVSIHAPTKGATINGCITTNWGWCFNPRSHEGSDVPDESSSASVCVSIHAPTKGATKVIELLSARWCVSIHAPTKGATFIQGGSVTKFQFQSTLPRRERLERLIIMHKG